MCPIIADGLHIIGLNSASFAEGDTIDKGNLIVGEPIIRDLYSGINDDATTISIIHHPLKSTGWYKFVEDKTIKQVLAKTDFMLCGHNHSSDVVSIYGPQGSVIEIVGGASYEGRQTTINQYNFVTFDTESRKGTIFGRRYVDDGPRGPAWFPDLHFYEEGKPLGTFSISLTKNKHGDTYDIQQIESISKENNALYDLVESQIKELNRRPLLSQTHPGRDSMKMLFPEIYIDTFVLPRKVPSGGSVPLSEWLNNNFRPDIRVLIVGDAGSGKTTSMINFYLEFAEKFLRGSDINFPVFFESKNHEWGGNLDPQKILGIIAKYFSFDINRVDPADKLPFPLIDGVDEIFTSAFQKIDASEISKIQFDFPHFATCRYDFYQRNLNNAQYLNQYDEILVLQPWSLDREVPQFIRNYFVKKKGTSEEKEISEVIQSLVGFDHISPLLVTIYLFIWLYERDEILRDPPRSFTMLMDRFVQIWLEREISAKDSIFSVQQLIDSYERISWMIYQKRRNGESELTLSKVSSAVGKSINIRSSTIDQDQALLSLLRIRENIHSKSTVSFLHETFNEFFLAKSLANSIMHYKKHRAELRELLGYGVNRFARSMLESISFPERTRIVQELRQGYLEMVKTPNYGNKIIDGLVSFFGGHTKSQKTQDKDIIERHNICYFWSRIESTIEGETIPNLYRELLSRKRLEHPMIYTTVGSGVLLSGDADLSKIYLESLSDDTPQDICNRIYHRVYYGDAEYKNTDTFLVDDHAYNRDDWSNTRLNILKRLQSDDLHSKIIRGLDIVTLRRLCETRGKPTLSESDKESILHSLDDMEGICQPIIQLIKEEQGKLLSILDLSDN